MGLRIVCGRAGTGKTFYCIKEIMQNLLQDAESASVLCVDTGGSASMGCRQQSHSASESGPTNSLTGESGPSLTGDSGSPSDSGCSGASAPSRKLFFLVPEQFTVQAEKILLAEPGSNNSMMRADVVNFKRMAYRLSNETGLYGSKIIDNSGRRMILYKAIEECKDNLKLFKGALEHFGLVSEILKLITEAGRYNFSEEKMLSIAEEISDELPIKQKLAELSMIYNKYNEILHRNYVDDNDLMDILAERIKEYKPYENCKIWIDGFFGFTQQEYKIIKELTEKAEEVTITLCCDNPEIAQKGNGADFLKSVYGTYDKLVRMAEENGISLKAPIMLKKHEKPEFTRHGYNRALEHFEREYDSYPVKPFHGDTSKLGIYAAKTIYSEAEFAACKIRELCREKGLHYRDIAVIAKDINSYAPVCKDIFIQNGIPFFIDSKKDLTRHPLARLIISALETVTEGFSYKTMFTYLKTGLLSYDQEVLDLIENHVLRKNISSIKRWTNDEWWVFEEEDERINETRREILEPLMEIKEELSVCKNILQQANALYNFLENIQVADIIINRESKEYIKTWNGFISILDKMTESLGEERVTPSKFLNILRSGLQDYQTGEIPTTLDNVLIGNLDRTKNARIKALIFLGVNEGVVPGGASKEGIISDKERQILKDKKIYLAADANEQIYLEEFNIYSALMAPSDYLYITYKVKDSGGKGKRPSRIINRVLKMFPDINFENDIIEDEMFIRPLKSIASSEFTFTKYLSYLSEKTNGREADDIWEETGKYFSNKEQYQERIDKALEYRNFRSRSIEISKEQASKLFGESIITSVSRVEKYNTCPYSFYAEYGLRAEERKILSFNSREAGSFIHEILEMIAGNMQEADIDSIVKNVLAKDSAFSSSLKDSRRTGFFAKRIGNMVKNVISIIDYQIKNGKFVPYEFEAECNLNIPLSSGKRAKLTGKIDRIDMYKEEETSYYRVIDYKTGEKSFDFSEVYEGTSIQLMAYLDSIIKNSKSAYPAGGLYFTIQDFFTKAEKGATRAALEAERRKQYKFSGLVLADEGVAKAMDFALGSSSDIIPAGIKGGGTFTERSSVATEDQFEKIFLHVEGKIASAIDGYTGGKVAPSPIRKGREDLPCKFCKYGALCGFDTACGDTVRKMKKIDKKTMWKLLGE